MALAPAARVAAVRIGVTPVRSLVTTTLVNALLPVFLIVPLKERTPPGPTGVAEQFSVMEMLGAVPSGQVADALLVTLSAVQASAPVATAVLLTEHALSGAEKLALKFADTPGARLATFNTVVGDAWLSTTVTSFKVTLPELRTVPL